MWASFFFTQFKETSLHSKPALGRSWPFLYNMAIFCAVRVAGGEWRKGKVCIAGVGIYGSWGHTGHSDRPSRSSFSVWWSNQTTWKLNYLPDHNLNHRNASFECVLKKKKVALKPCLHSCYSFLFHFIPFFYQPKFIHILLESACFGLFLLHKFPPYSWLCCGVSFTMPCAQSSWQLPAPERLRWLHILQGFLLVVGNFLR